MARNLHNLIRLHKWGVDEKRRQVGDVIRAITSLEAQALRLEEEVKEEQKIASDAPDEAGFFYGNYAEAVILRRDRLVQAMVETEKSLELAREELNVAYRELKKYETVQAGRDRRDAKRRDRKEQDFLDELGLKAYLRRRRHA